MKRRQFSITLLLVFLGINLLAACSVEISEMDENGMPLPTEGIVTATLYPTFTPHATATLLPATALPTVKPVSGKATAQINVRQRPSTASKSVGLLEINSEVGIVGKDASGAWYQVNFDLADGTRGEGWVSADYILTESKPDVPVTSGGTSTEDENTNGSVTQQINVRSGPGIDFEALGMLAVGDGIVITGKNIDGTWYQIEYASGVEGKGWVFAAYVETSVADDLPIIGETGEEITAPTQTSVSATASPVYTPAPNDGDSLENPAILVTFSTNDSRAFSYSSDVSSPEGDAEDWIAFHPNSDDSARVNILVDLACSGDGTLYVEMWQGNVELKQWGSLECGDTDYALSMFRDETYAFRLYAKRSNDLTYTNYTLQVRVAP